MKKNVPTVEEQKPKESSQAEAAAPVSPQPVPSRPIDSYSILLKLVKDLPEDKVQAAEAYGLPIRGLLQWAATITTEIKEIKETLPETIKAKMLEANKESLEQFRNQAAAGGGSGQVGGLNPWGIIEKVMSMADTPAQASPLQQKANDLMAKLLDRAISSVTEKSEFERYFEEEIAKAKAKAMAAQVAT